MGCHRGVSLGEGCLRTIDHGGIRQGDPNLVITQAQSFHHTEPVLALRVGGGGRDHGTIRKVDQLHLHLAQAALAPVSPSVRIGIPENLAVHFRLEEKGVRLQVLDPAIAGDHRRQAGALHLVQVGTLELVLVPELVAVPQPGELVCNDGPGGGAHACPGQVFFCQHAHPKVDFIHRPVDLLQLGLQSLVISDLAEIPHLGQAIGRASGVVVAQAVVAATLNVQRRQVQATLSGLTEQEVTQLIHHLQVHFLAGVAHQVFQDAVHTQSFHNGRVEKRVLQGQRGSHLLAVVVHELDVAAHDAVAEAESGGGELVGDGGIHLGFVAAVLFQA